MKKKIKRTNHKRRKGLRQKIINLNYFLKFCQWVFPHTEQIINRSDQRK